jgi:putative membrane protein
MIVGDSGSMIRLLIWQWKNTTLFVLAAVIAAVAHEVYEISWLVLPSLPLAVCGGALGIFVSFRANAAYGRWWEGRQLWGRLVNASRHLCSQAMAYLAPDEPAAAERVIMRQVAYVHTLRVLLRQQSLVDDPDLVRLLDDEQRARLAASSNATHAILLDAAQDLRTLSDRGLIDGFRLSDFDDTLRVLLDVQGGCERIKKTPMPRAYGLVASRMVVYYGVIFPFGIAESMGYFAIPMSLLVSIAFTLISEAGRVLEDPFNMFYNGLPLSALSATIEANLREPLGHDDVPAIPTATPYGVLM